MNEGAEGLIYSDVPEEVFNGNPAAFLDCQMELTARVTWKQRDDKERMNVCNHWNNGQRRR